MDPELARKNLIWGLALLLITVLLTVGAFLVAIAYNAAR